MRGDLVVVTCMTDCVPCPTSGTISRELKPLASWHLVQSPEEQGNLRPINLLIVLVLQAKLLRD